MRRQSRASKSTGLTPGIFDRLLNDDDNPLSSDDDDPFAQFDLNDEQCRVLWFARQPELFAEAKRRGLTAQEFAARATHYAIAPIGMT